MVLRWVLKAADNAKSTRLNLARKGLTSFPEEITKLTNIRILYLEGNRLTRIPAELARLKHLEQLYLDDNRLTRIPEELGRLSGLKIL